MRIRICRPSLHLYSYIRRAAMTACKVTWLSFQEVMWSVNVLSTPTTEEMVSGGSPLASCQDPSRNAV